MAEERMRRSEFADLIGISRGRVTQLAKEGKLVLAEDGRDILVGRSLDLLAQSCQVEKMGDAFRRAIDRRRDGATVLHIVPPSQPPQVLIPDTPPEKYPDYNRAKAENEIKKGIQLDIEIARLQGNLVSRDGVQQSMQAVATAMRTTLEKFPDNLATRLAAENDAAIIYAMLHDEIEAVFESCRHSVRELMKEL